MNSQHLTIKELTDSVAGNITPRMVRHYHQIGLLPTPERSPSNYRLYNASDIQRLKQIVALKQQGFQLKHIHQLLSAEAGAIASDSLLNQLQQQYQSVIQQLAQLRQTALALEGMLGQDSQCQTQRAVQKDFNVNEVEQFWQQLDVATHGHPEAFEESLQRLLPDLSGRSSIEVDLLSKLVLACGDVSLVQFVQKSKGAIAAARHALQAGSGVVGDVSAVVNSLDQTRLAGLGCSTTTLIDDPHITSAVEAERAFWQQPQWQERLQQVPEGAILAIGFAPSVLMFACESIERGQLRPALVIGMPIGFSHAPVAKRRLMRSGVPYLTIQGSLGGGLLAAVALNALADSLIEKPDCHCYLNENH